MKYAIGFIAGVIITIIVMRVIGKAVIAGHQAGAMGQKPKGGQTQ